MQTTYFMPINDANLIKEKILRFIEINGPSLPVHIAKNAGMDIIFTSAFLSELISHQKIKVSNMKIGTSPLYFIPGQEEGLEKFSNYIKGKEYEAFSLIKKEKFLEDSKQEPAIRIALRGIKDFAKPFEKEGEIIWRYFSVQEGDYKKEDEKEKKHLPKKEDEKEEMQKKEIPSKKKKISRPSSKKRKSTKQNDEKFFNKVKEYLSKNKVEIMDIVSFNKKDLILKVKERGDEKLLIAYNKKRITEKEVLGAHKKAEEEGLNYSILSIGEIPKKIQGLINAARRMDSIKKIE